MPIVKIPIDRITDWDSFHDVFTETMGFPDFYGRNMEAWIVCMSSLNSKEDGMTTIHCTPPEVVTLDLGRVSVFCAKNKEIFDSLIECSAFVNHRKIKIRQPEVIALSFWMD
ncbi:MAG: barstar family protein [Bacteroidota bacterium]